MPDLSGVRAVAFDLDDTLYDHGAAIAAGLRAVQANLDEAHRAAFGDCFEQAAVELRDQMLARGEADWPLVEHMQRSLAAANLAARFPPQRLAAEFLRATSACHGLLPDAHDVVDTLRAAGWPLGLLSNGGGDEQRTKLRRTGLEGRFDACLISGEIGVHKPAPAAFRKLAAELGLQPEQIVFVGNDPVTDIGGASRVGMIPVWVTTDPAATTGAAAVIPRLAELFNLLPEPPR